MSKSANRKSDNQAKRSGVLGFMIWWVKRLFVVVFLFVVSCFSFVWYTNYVATQAGEGVLYDVVDEVPHRKAGLVFGCSEKLGSRDNLYFKYRIEAAVALWKAGKVDCLIVSGDNREKYYNEPVAMRKALVKAGVPFKKIVCDYAGLRTLDSVIRAKKIFGLEEVTLISQKFQNERAAYIAKANGMDVIGYNATGVEGYAARKTEDREVLARVKMWLDVHITNKQPRHLGDKVPLPE